MPQQGKLESSVPNSLDEVLLKKQVEFLIDRKALPEYTSEQEDGLKALFKFLML